MRDRAPHNFLKSGICWLAVLLPCLTGAQPETAPSLLPKNGVLASAPDTLGNQIPNFSFCGYEASDSAIPLVPAVAVVRPMEGDATATLQQAIDYVAALPLQANGFRGAVLIEKGLYKLQGRLTIRQSGIVIRGRGRETVLEASGIDRETLIRIEGKDDRQLSPPVPIMSSYVPVGGHQLEVSYPVIFEAGDEIRIQRPSTQAWIKTLEMDAFGGETGWLTWKPGERDITWERTVTDRLGNRLTLDAPLTTALETRFGGGLVSKVVWPGRIERVGIENLQLQSQYNPENLKDEDHCWNAVSFENMRNGWVRKVHFSHFAGSAVAIYASGSRITVQDCISTDPVSEIAGERRNTFFTEGQQTLFLRCYSAYGMHDFAAGFCAAGPNAFVQCTAYLPFDFSGSIDSWASGLLFDNVKIDGQAIRFGNLDRGRQGAGWNAANSMIWQCSAALIECARPPGAFNWAYGVWARFKGNGLWYEANSHIDPPSLFFAQLAKRTGKKRGAFDDQLLTYEGASTSKPSHEEAAAASELAKLPAPDLYSFIEQRPFPDAADQDLSAAVRIEPVAPSGDGPKSPKAAGIELRNGLLTNGGRLVTGRQMDVPWWRGDDRPYEAAKSQPAVTRFVPGRSGLGYTDRIDEVVNYMEQNNIALLNHNYGLWYDRRRDDHERVRRMEPDSWAPFYEQPFARSGQGEAWDRLSKYDLTKFNRWYWRRLKSFADAALDKGKILMHQHYFQHNILEAGAHWVDSPWRPANNINDTGFPDPPNFAGDKRIFFAEQFYDVTHPVRRALHRGYIRHCLDEFKDNSNVLQSISAEFTGPLHFVEFWLDVIAEWETENENHSLICLSATKDVQDAILENPAYNRLIDVIDIRYWGYREDGSLYAPAGGVSLAPRQNDRLESAGKKSFQSVYRSVSEYRLRYPGKAVIYSENQDPRWGWAVFMAGGSLPPVTPDLPGGFYALAAGMQPVDTGGKGRFYALENDAAERIIYAEPAGEISYELNGGNYWASYFTAGGKTIRQERLKGKKSPFAFKNNTAEPIIICLHKNAWGEDR